MANMYRCDGCGTVHNGLCGYVYEESIGISENKSRLRYRISELNKKVDLCPTCFLFHLLRAIPDHPMLNLANMFPTNLDGLSDKIEMDVPSLINRGIQEFDFEDPDDETHEIKLLATQLVTSLGRATVACRYLIETITDKDVTIPDALLHIAMMIPYIYRELGGSDE